MPKDIGSLYSTALKGSLKNLTTQVKESLLKQNFDDSLKNGAKVVPLTAIPDTTVIKSRSIAEDVPPTVTTVEELPPIVEVLQPVVEPPPQEVVKPATKLPRSGSTT